MKKTGATSRKPIPHKSREEEMNFRGWKYCFYCGVPCYPVTHHGYVEHNLCKNYQKPIYFDEQEMGALIGMYALGFRLGLIGGDVSYYIARKLQLWCKKYGFPQRSSFGMKIDETTFDDDYASWLANIRESSTEKKKFWSSMVAKDTIDRRKSYEK